MRSILATTLGVALVFAGVAEAGVFTSNLNNDTFQAIQGGGGPNGIVTPRDNNDGSPDINDAFNALGAFPSLDRNYQTDPFQVSPNLDDIWTMQGNSGTVVLIGLTAGNSNTLGFYTDIGTGSTQTQVFPAQSGFGLQGSGVAGDPFMGSTMSLTDGTNFGWYLQSNALTFYSEASLNAGGYEHMLTYDVDFLNGVTKTVDFGNGEENYTFNNAFLLTWEDLPLNPNGTLGDEDYDDMIFLVDFIGRPVPGPQVPEPSTLAVWSVLGLAGLASRRRRRV